MQREREGKTTEEEREQRKGKDRWMGRKMDGEGSRRER